MEYQFAFERLDVWQRARELASEVYKLASTFPEQERYGMCSQMQRAAVSVASNIAEGSGRSSRKDQGHFTQLAYGSLMELMCQLTIAGDLQYVPSPQLKELRSCVERIARMLSALRNSQLGS
jgi:four helix bundle protein